MREKLLKFKMIVAIVFASTTLFAQNEKDSTNIYDLSLEQLMNIEVTTASKKKQKISDAPATVISISAEQIEKYGWSDLKDIFRALIGVDVSYDVQGEVRTLVTIRGVEGNQKILVLQDGQRQNPITGERFVYAHNIPLNIYKRIEIVYGPASALYGADAYAGVINLITKEGKDIDGITGNIGYITTNAIDASIIFGKQINEDIDVVISGRIYNGEDYALHEDYKDLNDYGPVANYSGELGSKSKKYPIKNWNFLTKVKYKKFTFGFDWQHELESNAPTCIPANYAYIENNVWGQDIRHFYVDYNLIKNEKLDLSATATVGDYAINTASNFYISNSDLSNGSASYKYGYSSYASGLIKANWTISPKFSIISGISSDVVKSFPKTQNLSEPYHLDGGLQDDLSQYKDSNNYVYGIKGLTDSIFGERNYYNVGGFVQAEYIPIEKISIVLGARYDYNSVFSGAFNPRAGVVYRATSKLTFKALYGTAYIQPSNYYRWENWANPFAMHIPNENIKPEKLQTIEFNTNYFINKNVSVRASIFRNDMTDIIRPIPADPQEGNYPYYNPLRTAIGASTSSGFVEINGNLGKMYSQGVELDVNFQISKILTSLGYTYLDGEDMENNTKLAKTSQHKLNWNIAYTTKKFNIALTTRYYSDVNTTNTNTLYGNTGSGDKSLKFAGATIFYANAYYKINKSIRLQLACGNMLNTKHYGAAPYGESIWIQSRAPQALRKIIVGITFNI